jgi:hypothetical protein
MSSEMNDRQVVLKINTKNEILQITTVTKIIKTLHDATLMT